MLVLQKFHRQNQQAPDEGFQQQYLFFVQEHLFPIFIPPYAVKTITDNKRNTTPKNICQCNEYINLCATFCIKNTLKKSAPQKREADKNLKLFCGFNFYPKLAEFCSECFVIVENFVFRVTCSRKISLVFVIISAFTAHVFKNFFV